MVYSKWASQKEIEDNLRIIKIKKDIEVKQVGLPVGYDDDSLLISGKGGHSLIIGSTGSGKTQIISLPILELAKRSGESSIVIDVEAELYNNTSNGFKDSGYNVLRLDLNSTLESISWNPFDLVIKMYKAKDIDRSVEYLNEIGYYIFNEDSNADPFWTESAISYFVGLSLYSLDKYGDVNFEKLGELDNEVEDNREEFINGIDKKSLTYITFSSVLLAPTETFGSILAVYRQKMKFILGRPTLTKILSKTSFDITKIKEEKTIIYVVPGKNSFSERLISLFINQVYSSCLMYTDFNTKLNVILDDFYYLYPIKDFTRILNTSRGNGITFTMMIQGFNELYNKYGKEQSEIIKINVANIVFLLSQDIPTLTEISNYCGETSNGPLISVNELKTMKYFEAIILTSRSYPIKTKLLPFYKMEI